MKCPILTMTSYLRPEITFVEGIDCLQAECAWWEEQTGHCSIRCLPTMISGVAWHINEIIKKMPHEEPFRK